MHENNYTGKKQYKFRLQNKQKQAISVTCFFKIQTSDAQAFCSFANTGIGQQE